VLCPAKVKVCPDHQANLFNDWVPDPFTNSSSSSPGITLQSAMPSHSKISSSVMEEAYNLSRDFATDVLKLFQCNRRKNAPAALPARSRQSKMVRNSTKQCDSDASKSTEPGDASNNELSDKSYLTDGSTSGSKARAPLTKNPMRSPATRFAPPGLSSPPGLDAPTGLNGNAMSFVPSCGKGGRTDSGLNAGAPCFKPSFATVAPALQRGLSQLESQGFSNPQQLRQSIKMLKGALEEWESNLPASPAPAVAPSPAAGESQGLFEALAKLTPAEAATVRSMLDCKLAPYSAAPAAYPAPAPVPRASMPPGQLSGPSWRMEQQRPFTPFRGSSRPASDQARSAAPKGPPGLALAKEDDNSLSKQLRDLSEMDNKCVLMVRKINRLGLNSGPPLQEHFSKFGSVHRVMVTPTRSKAQYGQASARVRPAPLGFVVMSKPEEVAAILAHGADHVVEGQSIGVFPFESHSIDNKD